MTTPLPEKIYLNKSVWNNLTTEGQARARIKGYEVRPDDLTAEALVKYLAHYAEKARRKDPSQPGVAQEALDCLAELKGEGRSTAELWEQYGYSIRSTVRPAVAEETRLVRELAVKPSADVVVNPAVKLVVTDVKTKYSIDEYVAPVVEPVEPTEPKEIIILK